MIIRGIKLVFIIFIPSFWYLKEIQRGELPYGSQSDSIPAFIFVYY